MEQYAEKHLCKSVTHLLGHMILHEQNQTAMANLNHVNYVLSEFRSISLLLDQIKEMKGVGDFYLQKAARVYVLSIAQEIERLQAHLIVEQAHHQVYNAVLTDFNDWRLEVMERFQTAFDNMQ